MIRLYRPFYGKKINEHDFVAMATHEVARLTDLEPAPLGFILPSVTIVAEMTERDEFLIQVRRDLDEWHRWLRSIFFTGGNVRRWARYLDPETHEVLIRGIFILHGELRDFNRYVKSCKKRSPKLL